MFYQSLLLSSFAVAASAVTTNSFCKGGLPASTASALAGNTLVQSYCSSNYPLPVTTLTSTAPAKTTALTASTTTITTVVATSTVTQTGATPAGTATSGTTAPAITKRAVTTTPAATTAKTTVNSAQASALSSLTSMSKTFVASVCSCLETQRTTTITTTPTVTLKITSVTTTSVTSTTTTTVTGAPTPGPVCNSAQLEACTITDSYGCSCAILVADGKTPVCANQAVCEDGYDVCKTDADCAFAFHPQVNGTKHCVYSIPTLYSSCKGHTVCVSNDGKCAADPPAQQAKREIEDVFVGGGASGLGRRSRILW